MIGSRTPTATPHPRPVRRAPREGSAAPLHLLAALGVAVAAWSTPDPGSRVAVLTLGLPCLLLTAAWLRALPDDAARVDLPVIVLVAVILRLGVFAAVRYTVGPYVFAPDAWTYEIVGGEIVDAWRGLRDLPAKATGSIQVGYYYLNAGLTWIFGRPGAGAAALNVFFGAWTTVPVYFLARRAARDNRGVGRWAAWLTAAFPSLVLWSVLNLREAPTIFLLVAAVQALGSGKERLPVRAVLVAGLCVLGLGASREYLALLVGAGLFAGLLVARAGNVAAGSLAGLLLVGAVAAAGAGGAGAAMAVEPSLETLEAMRRGLAQGAETAYGAAFDVSTPAGAARFLPVGLIYYLLAPFPWDLGSTLQSVTVPETLIWYTLIPFTVWGVRLGLKHDRRAYAVILSVLMAIIVPYALVQGNVGTAFRHRAQVLPLLFVFTAVGLRDAYGALVARRRERAGRRRRAGLRLSASAPGRAAQVHGWR